MVFGYLKRTKENIIGRLEIELEKYSLVKKGKWYLYKKGDLYNIYSAFLNFYNNCIVPKFGFTEVCNFEYDSELCLIKLHKYKIGGHSYKILYCPLKHKDTYNDFVLLLKSLEVIGVCNAPFTRINLTFNTKINCIDKIGSDSLVIVKGTIRKNSEKFTLKGSIL